MATAAGGERGLGKCRGGGRMFMATVTKGAARAYRSRPDDFDAVFVLIGRRACEGHYRVGRLTINRWLDEAGKEELIARRAEHVRSELPPQMQPRPCPRDFDGAFVELGPTGCEHRYRAHRRTVQRWLDERGREDLERARAAYVGKGIGRREIGSILSHAFPLNRRLSPSAVNRAAQFLRQRRNGGFIISPADEGLWWIGSRKRTAQELMQLAIGKGFDANLTGGGS